MMAGVTAKKCLWAAMRSQGDLTSRFDFALLESRAGDQIALLTRIP